MSINTQSLIGSKEAKEAFEKKASDSLVRLIASWPHMIDTWLSAINKVVLAGRAMSVTEANVFTDEEIKEISEELGPLAELEMRAQVREILIPKIRAKGFSEEIMKYISSPPFDD